MQKSPPLLELYDQAGGGMMLRVKFVAIHTQRTIAALGIASRTNLSTEQNDSVTKVAAFFFREDFSELPLDLFLILTL